MSISKPAKKAPVPADFKLDEFTHSNGTRKLTAIVHKGDRLLLRGSTDMDIACNINLDAKGTERLGATLCKFLDHQRKANAKKGGK